MLVFSAPPSCACGSRAYADSIGGGGRYLGSSRASRCRLSTYSFHSASLRIHRKRTYSQPGTNESSQIANTVSARCDQVGSRVRLAGGCLLYTSPSPRDGLLSR